MEFLSFQEKSFDKLLERVLAKRSRKDDPDVMARTREMINQVKQEGDAALYRFAERFDGVCLSSLKVSSGEIQDAFRKIPRSVLAALKDAGKNIEKFHKATLQKKEKVVKTKPGVYLWREFRPIERVGLYIPGGKAAYPSTVLMLALPAKIAGCSEIILCTPPSRDGACNPAVLAAAEISGVTKVFKAGGAGAIAAMAYGTQSIPKVSKIFGPGNVYVTAAKVLVSSQVAIDMPAGPSEVLVVADDQARPSWVAADLLSQLEHGEDSQAVLLAYSENFAQDVICEMKKQMAKLSRESIVRKSFEKSFAILVGGTQEASRFINAYAPEHLEIITKNAKALLKEVMNAGSIFLGPYANEPLGDYATGANHTLPTSGFAKMYPPLSTESFGKMIQVQQVDRQGIGALRKTVEVLASCERLDGHRNAVEVRFHD